MKRSHVVLAAIVLGALVISWLIRFGTDDAYISFIYARNLIRGEGLTWFGTYVEGYTNFSWVLWVAAGLWAGADPLVWAWAGSLTALAVALVVTYRLVQLRTGNATTAACATAVLATNFSFLAFGTSGLETMLQTALLTAAIWQVERLRRGPAPMSSARLAAVSVTCGFALWTRLDSAVVCAPLAVVLVVSLVRQRAPIRSWIAAVAPGVGLVAGWLVWKLTYYDAILPNTFHAKAGLSATAMAQGVRYVWAFLHAYMLWPVLLLVVVAAIRRRRCEAWLPLMVIACWLAYVVAVGGDFMEFRFFVPILPMLAVVVAELVNLETTRRSVPRPRLRTLAAVAILGTFSWRHAASFHGGGYQAFDSVRALGNFYGKVTDGDWSRIGGQLNRTLAGSSATLACNGAGAIPYFADLPTIDQLGLNDAWVAKHGARAPADFPRPGHQRFATYDYLVEQQVTFVIGAPTLIPRGYLSQPRLPPFKPDWMFQFLGYAPRPVHTPMTVVAAPMSDKAALLIWYLTPTPEITTRILEHGWEIRELVDR